MNARVLPPRIAGLFALTLWLGACGGGSNPPPSSGSAGAGSAGAGSAGENGSAGAGTAGTGTAGAGTAGAGTAGAGGAAGAGTAGAGTAGAGTAGSGTAGAGTAGVMGTAGAGTAGTTAMSEPSAGCNVAPASSDSSTSWVKHDVDVTGVDPAFISAHPVNAGGTYTWTHRNYFIRLPTSYDITKPYPVAIGGSGCGGSDIVGQEGGYSVLGLTAGETQGIQVAMSYVPSAAVNSCPGFADDFTNSPEPPYIHAVIADLEAKYCVDKSKIFLSGYSSGAWQATLSGCTNSDELRGYGVQIGGGLRLHRPACKPNPIAAIYVVGLQDTSNPIGPLTTPNDDSLGSAPSRDDILMRNGCTDKTTAPWDAAYPACLKYTSCPAKYPVVWCPIMSGHNPDPNDATVNMYRYDAIWKFYSTLP